MPFIVKISGGMFSDRMVSTRSTHEDALADALAYYRKASATPMICPSIDFERTFILKPRKNTHKKQRVRE